MTHIEDIISSWTIFIFSIKVLRHTFKIPYFLKDIPMLLLSQQQQHFTTCLQTTLCTLVYNYFPLLYGLSKEACRYNGMLKTKCPGSVIHWQPAKCSLLDLSFETRLKIWTFSQVFTLPFSKCHTFVIPRVLFVILC